MEISWSIHYPTPLPFLKAYEYIIDEDDSFPVSKRYMNQILSLPMYPELSEEMIEHICKVLNQG